MSYKEFLAKFPPPLRADEELIKYDIINQYNQLKKCQNMNLIISARMKMLQYVINSVEADPINGDFYNANNKKIIIEAGNELNKVGGFHLMQNQLICCFIPKRYHREIENYWDGIGEWRS
jgi:hypothetical protein